MKADEDRFFPGFPPAPPGHGQQGQGRGRTTGGPQGPAVVMQGGDLVCLAICTWSLTKIVSSPHECPWG